jgi:endonuclease III
MIPELIDLLETTYGSRQLIPHGDPLGELVQTILSQNTSDANSRPAYQALKRSFPDWESILEAAPSAIAAPIQSGGLALIKAQRIQEALREIVRRRGRLDLNFLAGLSVEEGLQWLKQIKGVGDKTASCVLLFALGKAALPVDTHVFRVSRRLGLIGPATSPAKAHPLLLKKVPLERLYPFHVLMIEHGRQVCLARSPRCSACVLLAMCQTGQIALPSRAPK